MAGRWRRDELCRAAPIQPSQPQRLLPVLRWKEAALASLQAVSQRSEHGGAGGPHFCWGRRHRQLSSDPALQPGLVCLPTRAAGKGLAPTWGLCQPRPPAQGLHRLHQYQVCGRHLPSEKEPEPTIYRMKLWAPDPVRAKSKFWWAPAPCCSVPGLAWLVCTALIQLTLQALPPQLWPCAQVLPAQAQEGEEGARPGAGRQRGTARCRGALLRARPARAAC